MKLSTVQRKTVFRNFEKRSRGCRIGSCPEVDAQNLFGGLFRDYPCSTLCGAIWKGCNIRRSTCPCLKFGPQEADEKLKKYLKKVEF